MIPGALSIGTLVNSGLPAALCTNRELLAAACGSNGKTSTSISLPRRFKQAQLIWVINMGEHIICDGLFVVARARVEWCKELLTDCHLVQV